MLDGGVDGAAALGHVADDDPQDAVVVVGIHEDLDVQLVPEFLAGEDEDALHDDHLGRLHGHGFRGGAGAGDVGVHRLLDGLALLELPDLLAHQFPVDGVGMVEVDVLAFLHGNVAGILVVGILGDDDHPALQLAGDGLDDRGLA